MRLELAWLGLGRGTAERTRPTALVWYDLLKKKYIYFSPPRMACFGRVVFGRWKHVDAAEEGSACARPQRKNPTFFTFSVSSPGGALFEIRDGLIKRCEMSLELAPGLRDESCARN